MKFVYNIFLLALMAVFALAATTSQRPVIVSYPKGTPDSIIEEAMEAVRKAVSPHETTLVSSILLTLRRAVP